MKKFKLVLLVCSSLVLLAGLVAGCGERIESNRYYYSPAFTRDGKIIYIGTLEEIRKNFLGQTISTSYRDYVATIYPTGTAESTLFEVTGELPYQMSASPTSDYVAYMIDLRNDKYGKIVIRYIGSGPSSKFELTKIPRTNLKSFDWSKDGQNLVYCTTNEVRTMNLEGNNDTLVTSEANLEFVSWKYGDRIAFVYSEGGSKKTNLGNISLQYPQISPSNTNEVYGISGSDFKKFNILTQEETLQKSNFSGVLPRISPDGKFATYNKSGESSGIYLLNLENGEESKVK